MSIQVQDLAVSESQLKRIELRLTKKLQFAADTQFESDEAMQTLEREVTDKSAIEQGLRDECKSLRFDNKQLVSMSQLVELLKQDKDSESAFKASLADMRKETAGNNLSQSTMGEQQGTPGGDDLAQKLAARKAAREERRRKKDEEKRDKQSKICCMTLEKNFDEIPAGSAERDKFCKDFVADMCKALGVNEADIALGELAAGSVIVPFKLRAPADGRSVDDIYGDLMQQISDPNSKLRTSPTTSAVKESESLAKMAEQVQPEPEPEEEEDDEEDDEAFILAEQATGASLGSSAPGGPRNPISAPGLNEKERRSLENQIALLEEQKDQAEAGKAKLQKQKAFEEQGRKRYTRTYQ